MTRADKLTPEGEEAMRINIASVHLQKRLQAYKGMPMNDRTVREIRLTVKEAVKGFRLKGIPYPELVPFVLKDLGQIMLYRDDLDAMGIQAVVSAVIREFPTVTPEDMGRAIGWAWPDFRNAEFVVPSGYGGPAFGR